MRLRKTPLLARLPCTDVTEDGQTGDEDDAETPDCEKVARMGIAERLKDNRNIQQVCEQHDKDHVADSVDLLLAQA